VEAAHRLTTSAFQSRKLPLDADGNDSVISDECEERACSTTKPASTKTSIGCGWDTDFIDTYLSELEFKRLVLDIVAADPRDNHRWNPEAKLTGLVLERCEKKRTELTRLWKEGKGHGLVRPERGRRSARFLRDAVAIPSWVLQDCFPAHRRAGPAQERGPGPAGPVFHVGVAPFAVGRPAREPIYLVVWAAPVKPAENDADSAGFFSGPHQQPPL
jgi:hypothetical protein